MHRPLYQQNCSSRKTIRQEDPAKLAAPDGADIRIWISRILLLGFGVSVYPHAIQRIFAAKSLSTLRYSLSGMTFMPFATTLLAFLLGIIAISRYQDLAGFDSAFEQRSCRGTLTRR